MSENIGHKIQIIISGAKLTKICFKSINCYRIRINKVPHRKGENTRSIVENFLSFLDINNKKSHVTSCFRLPAKSSKWTDRSLSLTIVVVFDSAELQPEVLTKYFRNVL